MRWMGLVLALLFLPLAAPAQVDDRSYLTALLEDSLSGDGRTVRLEGFAGALSSTATVDRITLADPQGIWLEVRDARLGWNRAALLTGRVEIAQISAREIVLTRLPQASDSALPAPEAGQGFALPELPVSVEIGQIRADRIEIGPALLGETILAQLEASASLVSGAGAIRANLTRLDLPGAGIVLEGDYANTTRELAVLARFAEPPGGVAARLLGLPGEPAVDLTILGAGPLDDFKADLTLATNGRDRLSGQVVLLGQDSGAQGFTADLGGDLTPLLAEEFHSFFGTSAALRLAGVRAMDGALRLDALSLQTAQVGLDGRVDLAPDGLPRAFDLKIDLQSQDSRPIRLPLAGDPVTLTMADLRLAFDGTRTESWELAGRVRGFASAALDLDSAVLSGGGKIGRLPNGQARAGGVLAIAAQGLRPDDPGIADLLGPAPNARIGFDWTEGQPLRLNDLSARSDGLRLSGALTLRAEPGDLAVDGGVKLDLTDMARLSRLAGRRLSGAGHVEWQGRLNPVAGAFDGRVMVVGRDLTLDQPQADRLLRGVASIEIDAARGAGGTEIRRAELAARDARIAASGWLRSTGHDLRADLALADLGAIDASLSGAVTLRATVTGDGQGRDRLEISGGAQDIAMGQAALDGLLRGATLLDIAVQHDKGRVVLDRLSTTNPRLDLRASGDLTDSTRRLEAVLTLRELAALGAGFDGAAEALLRYDFAQGRDLVSLVAKARDLSLGNPQLAPLLRGVTDAAARITRENGAVRIDGLSLKNPQIDISGTGQETGGRWGFDLAARLANLGLLVPEVPGPVTATARISDEGARYAVQLQAQGPAALSAQVSGTASPDFSRLDLAIAGGLDAAVAGAFAGPNLSVRGPVRFDLRLNGAPALSALSGQVALSGARLSLTNPPFVFSAVDATVDLAGGQARIGARAAAQTGGTLDARGTVALTAPFAADLSIALASLALRDPSLYSTSLNGALRIAGPLTGGAMIAGEIALGQTDLQIPSTGLGGVSSFPDLTHRAEPAAVRRTRGFAGLIEAAAAAARSGATRPYGLDIGISAPNRVFIRGRGLDAEMGGQFRITGSTLAPVPAGALSLIRGRLDLLGKRFVFTEGRIGVDGALVPEVLLVATTQTDAGEAGITVEGPADAPEIRFTSALGLPEEEVVARLLFGRGLDQLTAFQAAQLAAAVASLTGRGGAGMLDRLRQGLGLDDFDVGTDASGDTQLRAGRYLSENIYTDLTVTSGGKSEVSINLDVTESVTVKGRASSDGETGVGVFFERDY